MILPFGKGGAFGKGGRFGSGYSPSGGGFIPSLSRWHQVEVGQHIGAPVNGGVEWFWANAVPGTFQAVMLNIEDASFEAAQTIAESVSASGVSSMTGWGVNAQSVWNLDTGTLSPGAGSTNSPSHALSPVLELSAPILPGAYWTIQNRQSTGLVSAGKMFSNTTWPESGLVAGQAFQEGDRLGLSVTGIGVGPLPTRVFLRRTAVAGEFYNFMVMGDSTTVPLRPIASANNSSNEGIWHFGNASLRTAGKKVRIYSGGQGAASWAQIQARTRAALPWLAGKVADVAIQVWTWNSPWTSAAQADVAWAEYLVLEAEVEAAGFVCRPMILNPYTTRNSAGEIEGFTTMKAHVLAHPRGIALDTIMGGASWPHLIPAESEDDIHTNRDGGFRAGPEIAAVFLAKAIETHPELA